MTLCSDRCQLPAEFANVAEYSFALQQKVVFPGHVTLFQIKGTLFVTILLLSWHFILIEY
jgi:hypothetical protein